MRKRSTWISLIFLILLLGANFFTVFAESDTFDVPREVVNYYINSDGTATVEYTYEFTNSADGIPIDYVDIGLPNKNYQLSNVTADVNGQPVTDIRDSSNVSGITVYLGDYTIYAGQTGQVHVVVNGIQGVLYYAKDKVNDVEYASFNFMPNYFDSKYVTGSTDLTVTLILPAGMTEDQPRYYTPKGFPGSADPQSWIDNQGRVVYQWQSSNATAYTEYTFGGGFPASLVPAGTLAKAPLININFDDIMGPLCCVGIFFIFGGSFLWSIYEATFGARKRKLQYLPPKISIEGHGIKRGLTAVEVAILMEQPMDKVLTMILFSVLKKGAATVTQKDPLTLSKTEPLPNGLHKYEEDFLKAFTTGTKGEQRKALQDMMIDMVKSVSEQMRGFSRKETIDYYEDIMKRAWEQVEAAQTPEVKSQKYEEVMDWTMLDRKYDDRTRDTFGSSPVFLPSWWWRYDPGVHRTSGSFSTGAPAQSSSSSGGTTISMPSVPGADFAASMVTGVQTFSAGVIGDLTSFTGGVTKTTNPVPVSTRSGGGFGGGGGGGSHCACACACAGCACACAGGGR